jgi:dihydropteroate synthase
VLEALGGRLQIPVSIDTSKSQVAAAALDLGAEIINDVTGLESDPEMLPLAARSGAGVCAMHMQGIPQTMQDNPDYEDVVAEIRAYVLKRDAALLDGGVAEEKICLDPGIGFGKTHDHNLQLLAGVEEFVSTGRVILVGHSRKGFIAKILGDKAIQRDNGTLGVSLAMAMKGVHVLRIHDVAGTRQAFCCFDAAGGFGNLD